MNCATNVLPTKVQISVPVPKSHAFRLYMALQKTPKTPSHAICARIANHGRRGRMDGTRAIMMPGKRPQNTALFANAANQPPEVCQRCNGSSADANIGNVLYETMTTTATTQSISIGIRFARIDRAAIRHEPVTFLSMLQIIPHHKMPPRTRMVGTLDDMCEPAD